MTKNWSSGADRLASAARAAGFAMATPDDRPEDIPAPAPKVAQPVATAWTSASPQRALVVVAPRAPSYSSMIREWVSGLSWRAPA